jgi:hypothetical protein
MHSSECGMLGRFIQHNTTCARPHNWHGTLSECKVRIVQTVCILQRGLKCTYIRLCSVVSMRLCGCYSSSGEYSNSSGERASTVCCTRQHAHHISMCVRTMLHTSSSMYACTTCLTFQADMQTRK